MTIFGPEAVPMILFAMGLELLPFFALFFLLGVAVGRIIKSREMKPVGRRQSRASKGKP